MFYSFDIITEKVIFVVQTSNITMITKILSSSKNITPYGGLNFIYNAIQRAKIDRFIDKQIGNRNAPARYSYSDVVLSLLGNSLCQGDYISDLEQLKKKFSKQVFNKIPSPDTVEYVCQELKTATITHVTDKGMKLITTML